MSDAVTRRRGDTEKSDSGVAADRLLIESKIKKLTSAAVIGNVNIMSKLAPREKTIIPMVDAAIKASQFAKSFATEGTEFTKEAYDLFKSEFISVISVFSVAENLPRIHKLKIVPSPKMADPNRAENSDIPNI